MIYSVVGPTAEWVSITPRGGLNSSSGLFLPFEPVSDGGVDPAALSGQREPVHGGQPFCSSTSVGQYPFWVGAPQEHFPDVLARSEQPRTSNVLPSIASLPLANNVKSPADTITLVRPCDNLGSDPDRR